ncbi:unnamed protein product [Amoebophrya sp. A25]|nr:unnamed protein product [Amoebophrya sp. A25]|eukprot:GSA25T00008175001.1
MCAYHCVLTYYPGVRDAVRMRLRTRKGPGGEKILVYDDHDLQAIHRELDTRLADSSKGADFGPRPLLKDPSIQNARDESDDEYEEMLQAAKEGAEPDGVDPLEKQAEKLLPAEGEEEQALDEDAEADDKADDEDEESEGGADDYEQNKPPAAPRQAKLKKYKTPLEERVEFILVLWCILKSYGAKLRILIYEVAGGVPLFYHSMKISLQFMQVATHQFHFYEYPAELSDIAKAFNRPVDADVVSLLNSSDNDDQDFAQLFGSTFEECLARGITSMCFRFGQWQRLLMYGSGSTLELTLDQLREKAEKLGKVPKELEFILAHSEELLGESRSGPLNMIFSGYNSDLQSDDNIQMRRHGYGEWTKSATSYGPQRVITPATFELQTAQQVATAIESGSAMGVLAKESTCGLARTFLVKEIERHLTAGDTAAAMDEIRAWLDSLIVSTRDVEARGGTMTRRARQASNVGQMADWFPWHQAETQVPLWIPHLCPPGGIAKLPGVKDSFSIIERDCFGKRRAEEITTWQYHERVRELFPGLMDLHFEDNTLGLIDFDALEVWLGEQTPEQRRDPALYERCRRFMKTMKRPDEAYKYGKQVRKMFQTDSSQHRMTPDELDDLQRTTDNPDDYRRICPTELIVREHFTHFCSDSALRSEKIENGRYHCLFLKGVLNARKSLRRPTVLEIHTAENVVYVQIFGSVPEMNYLVESHLCRDSELNTAADELNAELQQMHEAYNGIPSEELAEMRNPTIVEKLLDDRKSSDVELASGKRWTELEQKRKLTTFQRAKESHNGKEDFSYLDLENHNRMDQDYGYWPDAPSWAMPLPTDRKSRRSSLKFLYIHSDGILHCNSMRGVKKILVCSGAYYVYRPEKNDVRIRIPGDSVRETPLAAALSHGLGTAKGFLLAKEFSMDGDMHKIIKKVLDESPGTMEGLLGYPHLPVFADPKQCPWLQKLDKEQANVRELDFFMNTQVKSTGPQAASSSSTSLLCSDLDGEDVLGVKSDDVQLIPGQENTHDSSLYYLGGGNPSFTYNVKMYQEDDEHGPSEDDVEFIRTYANSTTFRNDDGFWFNPSRKKNMKLTRKFHKKKKNNPVVLPLNLDKVRLTPQQRVNEGLQYKEGQSPVWPLATYFGKIPVENYNYREYVGLLFQLLYGEDLAGAFLNELNFFDDINPETGLHNAKSGKVNQIRLAASRLIVELREVEIEAVQQIRDRSKGIVAASAKPKGSKKGNAASSAGGGGAARLGPSWKQVNQARARAQADIGGEAGDLLNEVKKDEVDDKSDEDDEWDKHDLFTTETMSHDIDDTEQGVERRYQTLVDYYLNTAEGMAAKKESAICFPVGDDLIKLQASDGVRNFNISCKKCGALLGRGQKHYITKNGAKMYYWPQHPNAPRRERANGPKSHEVRNLAERRCYCGWFKGGKLWKDRDCTIPCKGPDTWMCTIRMVKARLRKDEDALCSCEGVLRAPTELKMLPQKYTFNLKQEEN